MITTGSAAHRTRIGPRYIFLDGDDASTATVPARTVRRGGRGTLDGTRPV